MEFLYSRLSQRGGSGGTIPMQARGSPVLVRRIQAVVHLLNCAPHTHTVVSTLMYGHDDGQGMEKNGAQACWLARQHSNGIARDCTE